ncbi:proline-rich protein 2-like [Pseudopipra pipra]|uniref:proline-rich protein 2-like n=1 Tax=Pseudopipra pipra TaxID=415032 RepID=UPI0031399A45
MHASFQFATKSSLSSQGAPAVGVVNSTLPGGKLPALQKDQCKENTRQGCWLSPLLVPHRLHSRDAVSLATANSSTLPILRIRGGQQTPERSPRNSLGGGCERCPRGALQAREPLAPLSPCPALLVPRKSKCRSSQGPDPLPLPGGGSAAPAERPRGPPGRQLLPAQPAWAERDPPAAPRLPQPRGRLCPPPPTRAARSARGETMGTMTSPSSNVRTSGGRRRLPPGRRDTPGPRLPGPLPPGLGPPPRGGSGSEAPLHPSPAATLRAAAAGGGPSRGTPPPPGPSAPPAPPRTHPRYLRVGGRKRRRSTRPCPAPRRKRLSPCVPVSESV